MAVDEKALRELRAWWMEKAEADFMACAPKALEYGAFDLEVMGKVLGRLAGIEEGKGPVQSELACWFYLLGKVARLESDYQAGRAGKQDTWMDAVIYAMMARRIQDTGQWP